MNQTKESTITIRVEQELRESFNRAAEAINRPAAQVLRDFMRDFVENTKTPAHISETEKLERREVVGFAKANVELEGFYFDKNDKYLEELFNQFIHGDVDIDTFVKTALEETIKRH